MSLNLRDFTARPAPNRTRFVTGAPDYSVECGTLDGTIEFEWNSGIQLGNFDHRLQIRVNWDQPILSDAQFWSANLVKDESLSTLSVRQENNRDSVQVRNLSRLTMEGTYKIFDVEDTSDGGFPAGPKVQFIDNNSINTTQSITAGTYSTVNEGGNFIDYETGELIVDPGGYYAMAIIEKSTGNIIERHILQDAVAPHMGGQMRAAATPAGVEPSGQMSGQWLTARPHTDSERHHYFHIGDNNLKLAKESVNAPYFATLVHEEGSYGMEHLFDTYGGPCPGCCSTDPDNQACVCNFMMCGGHSGFEIIHIRNMTQPNWLAGEGTWSTGNQGNNMVVMGQYDNDPETWFDNSQHRIKGFFSTDPDYHTGTNFYDNSATEFMVETRNSISYITQGADRDTHYGWGVTSSPLPHTYPAGEQLENQFRRRPVSFATTNEVQMITVDIDPQPITDIDGVVRYTGWCQVDFTLKDLFTPPKGASWTIDFSLALQITRMKGHNSFQDDDSNTDFPAGGDANFEGQYNDGAVFDSRSDTPTYITGTQAGAGWTWDKASGGGEASITVADYSDESDVTGLFPYKVEDPDNSGQYLNEYKIRIPFQPSGKWVYKFEFYRNTTTSESEATWEKVYDTSWLPNEPSIFIPSGCGSCDVDDDNIEWGFIRNWRHEKEEFVVTDTASNLQDYLYFTQTDTEGKYGDRIPSVDGAYHLRKENTFMLSDTNGAATGTVGDPLLVIEYTFGSGHNFYEVEGYGSDVGVGTTLPELTRTTTYTNDVTLEFPAQVTVDSCDFPYNGKYTMTAKLICEDTGITEWTEDITIIIDDKSPYIVSPENQIVADGDGNITFNASAHDDNGIWLVVLENQAWYNEDGFHGIPTNYSPHNWDGTFFPITGQVWGGDSGSDGGGWSSVSAVTTAGGDVHPNVHLDVTRFLTLEERYYMGNGSGPVWVHAYDWAGNCVWKMVGVRLDGGLLGRYPCGMCDSGAGDYLKPWEGEGAESQEGPAWNEAACNAEYGGGSWTGGICYNCLGIPYYNYDNSVDCIAETDPICQDTNLLWDNFNNCNMTDTLNITQLPSEMDPLTNGGFAFRVYIDRFLNDDCNVSMLESAEIRCSAQLVDWEISGPLYNEYGSAYMLATGQVFDWNDYAGYGCGQDSHCGMYLTFSSDVSAAGCHSDAKNPHTIMGGGFNVTTAIDGANCCDGCDEPPTFAWGGEDVKNAMAWLYTPASQRWDLCGIGKSRIIDGVEQEPTGATAVTIGKYGEIITAQDGALKTFIGNINESTDGATKAWEWHSKELSFGLDGQRKMYKGLKVRANGHFAVPSIEFYVDGKLATLERKNDVYAGEDLLNDWHTYEWKVAKGSRKGRICSVKFPNQPPDSQVESIDIVYRRKPVK